MTSTLTRTLLAAVASAGALALGAGVAQAQSLDGGGYGPYAGEITVSPPYRYRSWNGAPIQEVRAQRTVYVGDLDLRSDWGRRALYDRVERAAADACDEVNSAWTQGYYDVGLDSDCVGQTIQRTMHEVYGGY